MSYEAIVRGLVAAGVPKAAAEGAAAAEVAKRVVKNEPAAPAKRGVVHQVGGNGFSIPSARVERTMDTVTLSIDMPPRTKKNHNTWMGIASPAFRRFQAAVVDALAASVVELELPLPRQPYNMQAIFYVDSSGKTADLFGLLQGIADALQKAKVIENDWDFRTTDGSRVVPDDPNPRVEVTITPLEDV